MNNQNAQPPDGDQLPQLMAADDIADPQWIAQLPEPQAIPDEREGPSDLEVIAEHFPHIAQRMQEFWPKPRDFDDYMDSLLLMDRDSRKGFPKEILHALIGVSAQHRAEFPRSSVNDKPWPTGPSRSSQRRPPTTSVKKIIKLMPVAASRASIWDAPLTIKALHALKLRRKTE